MKARSLVWSLAWGLFAGCLVLYALTIVFAALYRFPPWDAPFIAGFVVTPAVGAVVASRQPRNAVGWFLLATFSLACRRPSGSRFCGTTSGTLIW